MDNVTLVFPTDECWDSARQAWNLAVDQQPAAVALPESAEEVTQAVRFARERGLRVVPQSTGHTAAPLGDLSGTILFNRLLALAKQVSFLNIQDL